MSAADLSGLQQINFGQGQSGYYDNNSGTYYDSGGNVLGAADLAAYGAFTVGSPGATPPITSSPVTPTASGSGGYLSGLTGLFSSIGAGITSGARAFTTPTVVPPGGMVYNPATGTYVAAGAAGGVGASLNPMLILALAGLAVWLFIRAEG